MDQVFVAFEGHTVVWKEEGSVVVDGRKIFNEKSVELHTRGRRRDQTFAVTYQKNRFKKWRGHPIIGETVISHPEGFWTITLSKVLRQGRTSSVFFDVDVNLGTPDMGDAKRL